MNPVLEKPDVVQVFAAEEITVHPITAAHPVYAEQYERGFTHQYVIPCICCCNKESLESAQLNFEGEARLLAVKAGYSNVRFSSLVETRTGAFTIFFEFI